MKKKMKNFFLVILKFKKTFCMRFNILKTVFKMFKTRFEKSGFAHPSGQVTEEEDYNLDKN